MQNSGQGLGEIHENIHTYACNFFLEKIHCILEPDDNWPPQNALDSVPTTDGIYDSVSFFETYYLNNEIANMLSNVATQDPASDYFYDKGEYEALKVFVEYIKFTKSNKLHFDLGLLAHITRQFWPNLKMWSDVDKNFQDTMTRFIAGNTNDAGIESHGWKFAGWEHRWWCFRDVWLLFNEFHDYLLTMPGDDIINYKSFWVAKLYISELLSTGKIFNANDPAFLVAVDERMITAIDHRTTLKSSKDDTIWMGPEDENGTWEKIQPPPQTPPRELIALVSYPTIRQGTRSPIPAYRDTLKATVDAYDSDVAQNASDLNESIKNVLTKARKDNEIIAKECCIVESGSSEEIDKKNEEMSVKLEATGGNLLGVLTVEINSYNKRCLERIQKIIVDLDEDKTKEEGDKNKLIAEAAEKRKEAAEKRKEATAQEKDNKKLAETLNIEAATFEVEAEKRQKMAEAAEKRRDENDDLLKILEEKKVDVKVNEGEIQKIVDEEIKKTKKITILRQKKITDFFIYKDQKRIDVEGEGYAAASSEEAAKTEHIDKKQKTGGNKTKKKGKHPKKTRRKRRKHHKKPRKKRKNTRKKTRKKKRTKRKNTRKRK